MKCVAKCGKRLGECLLILLLEFYHFADGDGGFAQHTVVVDGFVAVDKFNIPARH